MADKIIVHQYHKCGSQTMVSSCTNALSAAHVFDSHHQIKNVHDYIREHQDSKIFVVAFIREVLGRHISHVFQRLLKIHKHGNPFFSSVNDVKGAPLEDLNKFFFSYDFNDETQQYKRFFDQYKEFGIDVYEHSAADKKWAKYKSSTRDNVHAIIIRLDKCSTDEVENMMAKTFGATSFPMRRVNRNDMQSLFRNDSTTYKDFVKQLVLPSEYKQDILDWHNSEFMTNFFTEEELEQYRKRYQI
jgi:hypothetical protein